MEAIKLGSVVKDIITGFRGVVMVRTVYLTGCDHLGICPQELKEGKPLEWEWIDEKRCLVVKDKLISLRDSGKYADAIISEGGELEAPQM